MKKSSKVWAVAIGLAVVLFAFSADIAISTYTESADRETQFRAARATFVGATVGVVFYLRRRIKGLKSDYLTGCYLRLVAEERLDQIRGSSRNVTIAIVDVNGLRSVNNLYGHDVGDKLIREVARRLRTEFALPKGRKRAIVARLGGDEFIVIAEHLTRRMMCEQLTDCLGKSHPFGHWLIASAGVSRSRRSRVRDAKWCADQAMFRAKRTNSEKAVIYNPRLDGWPSIELDSNVKYHRTLHR